MKKILKPILKYYLKYITKLVLLIHKPVIIVVAGSTNKAFIKKEIKQILIDKGYRVRGNPKNFNTEFGLPLSVMHLPSGFNSYKDWLPAIKKAPLRIFEKNFPEYLVLSLGTSDPGDMKYLLTIIKPQIAIISDISQRYLEGFEDMNELVQEYTCLAKKLPKDGLLILNQDNPKIKAIQKDSSCQTISFGIQEKADYQAIDIEKTKKGQTAKILQPSRQKEYKINRFGSHHIYTLLVGLIIKDYVTDKK